MPNNQSGFHKPSMKQGERRDDTGETFKDLVAMAEGAVLQYMIARRLSRSSDITEAERHLFHMTAHAFLRVGESLEPLLHLYGHCSDEILSNLVDSMAKEQAEQKEQTSTGEKGETDARF